MTIRYISTTTAPAAVGPYSQAIEEDGLLFCSGQIPIDPQTGQMVEGGIEAQAQRVLKNLANLLSAGGSDLSYVLKTTMFLVDLADFKTVNGIYEAAFGSHKPARSTIQVAGLPMGSRIEIEAIARVVR